MTPGSNIGATAAEDRADRSPADSLAQAITDMAALHADTCDLDHPGSPSATVAILQEQPEAVDCLVLGDTTILLDESAGIRVVTDDRLEHVAAVQHSAMHQHATGSADHDRSFAQLVTEQRRHRNHPDGFWVASTDPAAAQPRVEGSGRTVLACPTPAASAPPTNPAPEPSPLGSLIQNGPTSLALSLAPGGLSACHGVHRPLVQVQGRPPGQAPGRGTS